MSKHNCETELKKCGLAYSGFNQSGNIWKCPKCGKTWVYYETEDEGGCWEESK